jgi:hypothetical protein
MLYTLATANQPIKRGDIMIHTDETLRALDGDFENYHYQLEDGARYRLTEGELGWLEFVRGRCSIADHLLESIDADGVYTVDTLGMSKALEDDDSFPKATCLSDDTTLQAIIFYSCIEMSN